MNRDEYKAITQDETGRAIREFLASAATRQPVRSRSALYQMLNEDGIPAEMHDGLVKQYTEFAKRGMDYDQNLAHLRQETDLAAVGWVRKIRAADDLYGEHGIPEGSDNIEDDDEVMHVVSEVDRMNRNMSEEDYAQEKADAEKRAELQRLGFRAG